MNHRAVARVRLEGRPDKRERERERFVLLDRAAGLGCAINQSIYGHAKGEAANQNPGCRFSALLSPSPGYAAKSGMHHFPLGWPDPLRAPEPKTPTDVESPGLGEALNTGRVRPFLMAPPLPIPADEPAAYDIGRALGSERDAADRSVKLPTTQACKLVYLTA